jgi:hypothetical protein
MGDVERRADDRERCRDRAFGQQPTGRQPAVTESADGGSASSRTPPASIRPTMEEEDQERDEFDEQSTLMGRPCERYGSSCERDGNKPDNELTALVWVVAGLPAVLDARWLLFDRIVPG